MADVSKFIGSDSLANKPLCIVPDSGPLVQELLALGFPIRILKFPDSLKSLRQRGSRLTQGLSLLRMIPEVVGYGFQLRKTLGRNQPNLRGGYLLSHGVKSHALMLFLSPWLRGAGIKLVLDIRDFIRPLLFRRILSMLGRCGEASIWANSLAVAQNYPGAEIHYPQVTLNRQPKTRLPSTTDFSERTLLHVAYWAPYKGQGKFLEMARSLERAGFQGRYWIAGESLYPAKEYAEYAAQVKALAQCEELKGKVQFFGNLPFSNKAEIVETSERFSDIQSLMENADLLVHCTLEPEPFGRVLVEAALCGCQVIARKGSGALEVMAKAENLPDWVDRVLVELGSDYLAITLRKATGARE
jgi:glycosyltransferase involved in cell wall biosynthesis